ncbi:MAG: hypothetical protein ACAI43_06445 [Phycisphaerae bacterium]|nr:hypothetical protein [Tepidisphaeraceae bacterium]
MVRNLTRLLTLAVLSVGLSFGLYYFYRTPQAEIDLRAEKEKTKKLQAYVQRLTDEKRVAQLLVTGQRKENGVLVTDVLFQEIGRDGTTIKPGRSFTVRGNLVYVTALSIRFKQSYMEENNPLRGHGIVLFDRIFGDAQVPSDAPRIDDPNDVPAFYRADVDNKDAAEAIKFEQNLWKNFWRLVDDKQLREKEGVEVATGKASYQPMIPERLYRVTVDARGNPTMDWEPVPAIYLEALRNAAATREVKAPGKP